MPNKIIDINGDIIDLSHVRAFSKVQQLSKWIHNPSSPEEHYDYGIKFIFKSGAHKTVWFYADKSIYGVSIGTPKRRDVIYNKISIDFGVEVY